MELSLSLPSLMSYLCGELAVSWQSSGKQAQLLPIAFCMWGMETTFGKGLKSYGLAVLGTSCPRMKK